jgi:hypothetical protein
MDSPLALAVEFALHVALFFVLSVEGLIRAHAVMTQLPRQFAGWPPPRLRWGFRAVRLMGGVFAWIVLLKAMPNTQAIAMPIPMSGPVVVLALAAGGAVCVYLRGREAIVLRTSVALFVAAIVFGAIGFGSAAPSPDVPPSAAFGFITLPDGSRYGIDTSECHPNAGWRLEARPRDPRDANCRLRGLVELSTVGHAAVDFAGRPVWIPKGTRVSRAGDLIKDDGAMAIWGYVTLGEEVVEVITPARHWRQCFEAELCFG